MLKTLTLGRPVREWTGAKNDPPGREPPGREPPGKDGGNEDGRTGIATKTRPKTKKPSLYKVLLLNDDYTPMEFVVVVIQEFFNKDRETATQIMLKIHLDGKGICGVYSRDVAATKVEQVQEAARQAGHPLQCVSEPVE
jgi:ATP-dependent Clp protease adaptor protein ClpS